MMCLYRQSIRSFSSSGDDDACSHAGDHGTTFDLCLSPLASRRQ